MRNAVGHRDLSPSSPSLPFPKKMKRKRVNGEEKLGEREKSVREGDLRQQGMLG